jgi:hypothetical protein
MWACLVACLLHEITSFVWTAAEAANLLSKSHTPFSGHRRIERTGQVIMQAAIFAVFSSRPNGIGFTPRHQNAFPS